jgi:hypothetical protein
MTHNFPPTRDTSQDETTLVVEQSQSFAAFEQWMDEQLEHLVARWIHAAAPNANRTSRSRRKFEAR